MERIEYKLQCPHCGCTYSIEVFELPQAERCAVCGYTGKIEEFRVKNGGKI